MYSPNLRAFSVTKKKKACLQNPPTGGLGTIKKTDIFILRKSAVNTQVS